MNRKVGDWDCGACRHLNFSRRDSCQRCGDLRPADRGEMGSFFGGGRSDFGSFGGEGFGGGRSEMGSFFGGGGGRGGGEIRPGDWYCGCGYHNFASRSTCFKCGGFKDEASSAGFHAGDVLRLRGFGMPAAAPAAPRSGWKSGDWICSRNGCNEHNFASRMECYRCSAPREAAGTEI